MLKIRRLSKILFIMLLGLITILVACSSNSTGEDDGTAPAQITDLAVLDFDSNFIILTWTATGDDGDVGTASGYDIRYLTYPLTWINWDSATHISGEPSPQPSGTTETFTLTGMSKDTTYFLAVRAYDEEGNSEGMSNVVSATCIHDFAVNFPDANLEAAIRMILGKPSGDILKSDLLTMEDLSANEQEIANLTGVENCLNLIFINLIDNNISSISPLADLTKLYSLNLTYNQVDNLSNLTGLSSLEKLYLTENQISDISPLAGLTGLTELTLSNNEIDDLSPLAGLINLQVLSLVNNQFTDISDLSGLTTLEELFLGANAIDDLSPLADLDNLLALYIEHTDVTDLSPISGLVNLEALFASSNGISDVNALAGLTGLKELNLNYNIHLTSIDSLVYLTNLQKLYLRQDSIIDIGPLANNPGLDSGDSIWLEWNPLSPQSIDVHIPALENRGVVVFYDE
jgi:hypothetical protein